MGLGPLLGAAAPRSSADVGRLERRGRPHPAVAEQVERGVPDRLEEGRAQAIGRPPGRVEAIEADDHLGDDVFGVGAVEAPAELAQHVGDRRAGGAPRRRR